MRKVIDTYYNKYADIVKKYNFKLLSLRITDRDEHLNEYVGVFYFDNDDIDCGTAPLTLVIDTNDSTSEAYAIYKAFYRWDDQADYYLSYPTIHNITDCVNEYFAEGDLWLCSDDIDLDKWLEYKLREEKLNCELE